MQKLFFPGPQRVELCGILTDLTPKKAGTIWILAHGHSSSKGSTNIVKLAQVLDKKGLASFRIDLYGHGESGGKYQDATISLAAKSILAAIRFLKSRGYKKIGLLGSSYGGIASIVAASKTRDLFALALKSPVSDYGELLEEKLPAFAIKLWQKADKLVQSKYWEGYANNVWLRFSFYEDAQRNSGYKAIKKVTIPVLIVHGDKDEDVPLAQSLKLAKLLKNGRLEIVPGADHRYTQPLHTRKMLALLSNFMLREAGRVRD